MEAIQTGEMRILDESGNTKLIWLSAGNDIEIDNAKETYDRLTGESLTPFSVKADGWKRHTLVEVDPDAEKTILVPPMTGG